MVKFGNDFILIMYKENVKIQTNKDSIQTISNVLFVLDLKTNLLSVGQLQEKIYEIIIKGRVCQIQDSKR